MTSSSTPAFDAARCRHWLCTL